METLASFLGNYKVEKGETYTHTTMGSNAGSYNIPDEVYDELYELIHKDAFTHNIPVHLTEKPPQVTMVKADIDFKFPLDRCNRQYTEQTLKDIVKLYQTAIKHYLEIESDTQLDTFVLERKEPYKTLKLIKDGIHIMFPGIICDTKIQHLIRNHVVEHCNDVFSPLKCTNKPDEIVDKAIISNNNWLMYGCCKPNLKPYLLTHLYNEDCVDLPFAGYSHTSLIALLSIRDNIGSENIPIKHELIHMLGTVELSKLSKLKPKISLITKETPLSLDLVDKATPLSPDLVEMLDLIPSNIRKIWISIGAVLHKDNFQIWEEWSKKSPGYTPGSCAQLIPSLSTYNNSPGIIVNYAKEYDLQKVKEIQKKYRYSHLNQDIIEDLKKYSSNTDFALAQLVHRYYKGIFVCVDIKNNTWYYFDENPIVRRWVLDTGGVKLGERISLDFIPLYQAVIASLPPETVLENGTKFDPNAKQIKSLRAIITKLGTNLSKKSIISEARPLLLDVNFFHNLDTANLNIIAFDNGLCYDTKILDFRLIEHDDYVSMSTGFIYSDIEDKTDDDVWEFWCQALRQQDKRDFYLRHLSQVLVATNTHEIAIFLTGCGGNSKGKSNDLLKQTLGNYMGSLPSIYLTAKEDSTGKAESELFMVRKKRLVVISEPDAGQNKFGKKTTVNIARLKEWTGRSPMSFRQLRHDAIEPMVPHWFPGIECNDMPEIVEKGQSVTRRVRNVIFDSKFMINPDPTCEDEFERDNNINQKFPKWRSAMFRLLIKYYKEVKELKNVIPDPTCVLEDSLELINEGDVISLWIAKNLVKTGKKEDIVTYKDLWDNFEQYFEELDDSEELRKPKKMELKKKLISHFGNKMISSSTRDNRTVHNFWEKYTVKSDKEVINTDNPEVVQKVDLPVDSISTPLSSLRRCLC